VVGTKASWTRPCVWSGNWSRTEVDITRILALDVGDSRVGLALSDPLGILASPLTIVTRADESAAIARIVDIIREKEVERVIAGLPLNMNGSLGLQAEKTKSFIDELSRFIDVPVEYRDERLSTVSARELIQGFRKTTRTTRYDAAAAALILQSYLDDVSRQQVPPPES
jgi:putative Holliday junction resolvase